MGESPAQVTVAQPTSASLQLLYERAIPSCQTFSIRAFISVEVDMEVLLEELLDELLLLLLLLLLEELLLEELLLEELPPSIIH